MAAVDFDVDSEPATAKSPNVGASLAKLMASQRSDNYDVVSMDVESPPKGSAEEEEEEALRRVLLEQVSPLFPSPSAS